MSRHLIWKNSGIEVVVGYEPVFKVLFLQVFLSPDAEEADTVSITPCWHANPTSEILSAALDYCSLAEPIKTSISNHLLEEMLSICDTNVFIDWTKEIPIQARLTSDELRETMSARQLGMRETTQDDRSTDDHGGDTITPSKE